MGDALHTGGTTSGGLGVTSAREARLAQAGLLAVQGPTVLDARTGVLVGPGSTALVTGTADTAPMAYNIAPHQWVTSRRTADGPYLGALDAVRKVATTAAPGTGSRIDVVWVRQADNDPTVLTPDAVTEDQYGVTQGTSSTGTPAKPAIPVGALELATATVAAGATRTNGAGVTITPTARQTVVRGSILPLTNAAEREALQTAGGVYDGLVVVERDTDRLYEWTGAAWQYVGGGKAPTFPVSVVQGWTSLGAPSAFLDGSGTGHLRGIVSNVNFFTPDGSQTILTLPSAVPAPASGANLPVMVYNGGTLTTVRCSLTAGGALRADQGPSITAGSFFYLDGLLWHQS